MNLRSLQYLNTALRLRRGKYSYERDRFFEKRTIVMFTLSLFVFFIHFTAFSTFRIIPSLNGQWNIWAKVNRIILAACNVAVPLFFIISGVMFFRNYNGKNTWEKLKSRSKSVLIPYLFWNSLWVIIGLLGQYTSLSSLTGGVKCPLTFKAIIGGIFLRQYNTPFWFIQCIIILMLLCTLIYCLLKNKWVGLTVITIYYILYCAGFRLNSDLFYTSDSVVYYLLGAWIGIHYYNQFKKQQSAKNAILGVVVFVGICSFHLFLDPLPNS